MVLPRPQNFTSITRVLTRLYKQMIWWYDPKVIFCYSILISLKTISSRVQFSFLLAAVCWILLPSTYFSHEKHCNLLDYTFRKVGWDHRVKRALCNCHYNLSGQLILIQFRLALKRGGGGFCRLLLYYYQARACGKSPLDQKIKLSEECVLSRTACWGNTCSI